MVPALFGFWPEEDIVLLTFGAARTFHGRLDLPPREFLDTSALGQLDEALLGPARHLRASSVVLIYYGHDGTAVRTVHAALRRGCRRSGIRVVEALHVDGGRYRRLDARGGFVDVDVSDHPFVLEAMVTGRLVHASRRDLVASLHPDPDAVARAAAALADHPGAGVDPGDRRWRRREGEWVRGLVNGCVATRTLPDGEDLARLLRALTSIRVRDAVWALIDAPTALDQVAFWTAISRAAPDAYAAAPAVLLGWAGWQAGNGALAWAGIDRCRAVDPTYSLAGLLADILERALPPEFWEPHFNWALGLP